MGAYSGPAEWWIKNTPKGRLHTSKKGIIQSGLVLNLDPGSLTSYTGSGATINDLTSNSLNSSLVNGVTFSTSNGGVLSTDGVDDHIKTPRVAGTGTSTSSVSWCVWVKPSSTGGNIMSMSSVDPQGSWNMPPIAASSSKFRGKVWQNNDLFSTSNFVTGNWYYVCLVFYYEATQANRYQRLYVNGVLQAEQTNINYGASGTNNFLFFGQANPGSSNAGNFSGSYGPIHVYNRALSQNEIQRNFNSLKKRFGL